jgi:hypothetical protein
MSHVLPMLHTTENIADVEIRNDFSHDCLGGRSRNFYSLLGPTKVFRPQYMYATLYYCRAGGRLKQFSSTNSITLYIVQKKFFLRPCVRSDIGQAINEQVEAIFLPRRLRLLTQLSSEDPIQIVNWPKRIHISRMTMKQRNM